jgi:hypothetical protein
MKPTTLILPLAGVLMLAGCATGRLEAQWSDPQFAGQTLAGAKVLVVCQAAEQTVVRICQDQLAAQLRNVGVTPVLSDSLSSSADKAGDKFAAARSLGARAIMMSSLSPNTTITNSGPSVGFGMGSGGYHSGVGIGMSLPVGSSTQTSTTTYASDTTLTDVSNGRLMWSGKASTSAQDVTEQLSGLAKVSVESARKAGML